MKALYLTTHFKTADDIHFSPTIRPKPVLKKGECLIHVQSAGVNPSDALGAIGYFSHAKLPRIPGRDFAGTIIKGTPHLIGKKVWGTGGAMGLDFDGSHAEYLAIPESAVAEIPHTLTLLEAGIQTLPYITAYYSLIRRARIQPGEKILILGALGQVGQAALSICFWKNCPATGFVRPTANLPKERTWEAIDERPNAKFDVILNSIGNVDWKNWMHCLKKGGRMVVIAAPEGKRDAELSLLDFYRANQEILGINTVDIGIEENAQMLRELKPGFETKTLTPLSLHPKLLFPLEQADLAYKMVLKGTGGKRVALFSQ